MKKLNFLKPRLELQCPLAFIRGETPPEPDALSLGTNFLEHIN